jgi:hypothetical protein
MASALAVVHNFICIYDPKDSAFLEDSKDNNDKGQGRTQAKDSDENTATASATTPADECGRAAERREQIAKALWRSYKRY